MNAPQVPFEDMPARPRHVLRAEHKATETSSPRCPVLSLLLAASVGTFVALVLVPPVQCPAVVHVSPAIAFTWPTAGGAA